MLRAIFGPKRDQVIKEVRNLNNEEFYYLYSSPNIVLVIKTRKMIRGERRGAYRVLLGKPEGKRPL